LSESENALDDVFRLFFRINDLVRSDDIYPFFDAIQSQISIFSSACSPARLGRSDISLFTANIPSNNQLL
jgi:hypothetical protein